jgi:hypothetical protein
LSYRLQRRRQHWPFSDYIVLSVAGRLCSLVLDALTAAHPSWLTEAVLMQDVSYGSWVAVIE